MNIDVNARQVLADAQREEWLTVKEYSALRRIHEQTVYAAIRRGLFPCYWERVGRSIRIDVSRASIKQRIAS